MSTRDKDIHVCKTTELKKFTTRSTFPHMTKFVRVIKAASVNIMSEIIDNTYTAALFNM